MSTSVEEYFDSVDGNDCVIGTAPRSLVHREKKFHRAVHIFVFNTDGRIFLQQRSLHKDSAPGKWVSACSGHVDSGEGYEEAARRELLEEIGLEWPANTRPVLKAKPCPATGQEFVWLYDCVANGPFTLDPNEIQGGGWFTIGELNRWIQERPRDFAWSFIHLWRKYLDSKLSRAVAP